MLDEEIMTSPIKKPRLFFLDNLKVLFAILVVFTHIRVAYGGDGSWYYISALNESNPVDIFSTIFFYMTAGLGGIFQASLMGLFFLMAAYFTPKSYDRKGASSFWKKRFVRIGIPILLYILLINPIISYLMAVGGIEPYSSSPLIQGSFIDYYLSKFQSPELLIGFLTNFSITWFLVVLLIFSAVYTIWRQIIKIDSIQKRIPKELHIPKFIYLLLFAIGLGFLSFLVRIVAPIDQFPFGIPVAYMIQYLMMFSVGVIAYRYGWFEQMTRQHVKIWAITMFAMVMLFFTYFFVVVGVDSDFSVFLGGLNVNALIFAIMDNIACMGIIFVLVKIFYAKFNKQGKLMKNLADSSLHIYLIHPFIAIPLSLGIMFIPLSPLIKLSIVFPITVILCYLVSHFALQKINFRKKSRAPQNS